MRLRGKYLCWLFVMMVFCAVSFGGCGGSSTASISGSEDITVPDTPANNDNYNPVPAPDTTVSPDEPTTVPDTTVSPDEPAAVPDDTSSSFWPDVNGTWKVDSGTFTSYITIGRKDGLPDEHLEDVSPFSRSEPVTFNLSVKKQGTDNVFSDTIVFSGEGVVGSGELYNTIRIYFTTTTNLVDPSKGETYEFVQTIGSGLHASNFNYIGDNTYKTKPNLTDEEHAGSYTSITFKDSSTIEYTSYSTYSSTSKLTVTLKRVN